MKMRSNIRSCFAVFRSCCRLTSPVPYKWAKEIESMDHGKVVAPDTDPDDQVTYLMLKKSISLWSRA